VVIDNQEDLPVGKLRDQLVAELHEAKLVAVAFEDIEQQRPVVADGADHVDPEALPGDRRDRALPNGGVAGARGLPGPQAHLVSPQEPCVLGQRARPDRRIHGLDPRLDTHGILLRPALRGPFRGELPGAQVAPDCLARQRDPEQLEDQRSHRGATPQHAFPELQLIRIRAEHRAHDPFLLRLRDRHLLTRASTPPTFPQPLHPAHAKPRRPLRDRPQPNPKSVRDLTMRTAVQQHPHPTLT